MSIILFLFKQVLNYKLRNMWYMRLYALHARDSGINQNMNIYEIHRIWKSMINKCRFNAYILHVYVFQLRTTTN